MKKSLLNIFYVVCKVILYPIRKKTIVMWFFDKVFIEDNFYQTNGKYNNCFNDKYNYVMNIYDGQYIGGGLADRLRGIITTYYYSKENHRKYKLYFVDPFNLSDYLIPNKVDWEINESEICFNRKHSKNIFLNAYNNYSNLANKQGCYLNNVIKKNSEKQIHVYTNSIFAYEKNYGELFDELFKPSNRLQKSIDKYLSDIGSEYISVSFRFLGLFNDFNERGPMCNYLSEDDKRDLLAKCISSIVQLHKSYPNNRILVNSDSTFFLNEANNFDYTYIVDGNVLNIAGKCTEYSYETFEKTFIDFFLISKAKFVYLFTNKFLYPSGFPYAASRISNTQFEKIDVPNE